MRKYILLILILGLPSILLAEFDKAITIRNMSAEGVLLKDGWKYHLGDNPEWAKPDYDDSRWQTVDPTPDIHELPMLWKDSIVWFRIYVDIDSTLIGNLALTVSHAGASEFYLNGRLFKKYGVVSSNSDEIFAINPKEKPFIFPVSDAGVNVLAVRYILEPGVHYTTEWSNSNYGLLVRINDYDNAPKIFSDTQIFMDINTSFRIAAFLILAILYLSFYISDPRQKTSLYFCVFALFWTIIWSLFFIYNRFEIPLRYYFYFANLNLILMIVGWFFGITAMYKLFGFEKTWIYYALYLFGITSIPIGIFIYDKGWYMYATFFTSFVYLDFIRISFLAKKRKKTGATILAFGTPVALVFWLLFMAMTFEFFSDDVNKWKWTIFVIHHLMLPVSVAIYIGYDFARTNRDLEQKLDEVKNLSKEKNEILTRQKESLEMSVNERTHELLESLENLKSTQSQLIQAEKMASLGELTAGIAHEIQNPLNFVNNFSEVSNELLSEMKTELENNNKQEAIALADDVKQNLEKILLHGKRADGIVKGMLQHSRSSSGVKEPTDINKLADEYLRLVYHGLRAKDKLFNAILKTDFDQSIKTINVVPQDMGRTVLNLITNAFYAVAEKKKLQTDGYDPIVSVSTKKVDDKVLISVKDNGNGIPLKVLDKIFHPFFTTKPTGQGTGLGLSMSYDIVKAHGGELKVETKEGEGTEFMIVLAL